VAILPIFGKLFLETVKAIWEMEMYELIYYGNGENFGITQKRFGLFLETAICEGKQLSTRVRTAHTTFPPARLQKQSLSRKKQYKNNLKLVPATTRFCLLKTEPNRPLVKA
jgi:hypothetical protein